MPFKTVLAIGCVGFCLNLLLWGPIASRTALLGAGDFVAFYAGARLAPARAEYDIEHVLQAQKEAIGDIRPKLMPLRPPFYYLLLRPLAKLSYLQAHTVWLAILAASAALATALFPIADRRAFLAASLCSLPLLLATLSGQDVGLVYLSLAVGLWLRQSTRPLAAGAALSLLILKFHLFLLLPVLFLLKREFRLLGGALLGLTALLAASFVVGGWGWPAAYVRLISNPLISPGPEAMPNLHGLVSGFTNSGWLEAVLSVLTIGTAIAVIARSKFPIALAAALICGVLTGHHAYIQDCVFLIPALLTIFQRAASPAREIALICLTPLPYVFSPIQHLGWIPGLLLASALFALAAGWSSRLREESPPKRDVM